jgi:DNA-directed RNA polymerase specialized sigma24 family protein
MAALGDRLNDIHVRILAESRTASLDLFKEAAGPVTGHIMQQVPGVTEDEAHDCALKAIIDHLENTQKFDSSKSSLWTYLCMVAAADGLDAVRKRRNHARLLKKDGFNIELWGSQPNKQQEDVENKRDADRIMQLHGDSIAKTDGERRVLALMLEDERNVGPYAQALGLEGSLDAAAEVKKVKDRITLRMKKVRHEL